MRTKPTLAVALAAVTTFLLSVPPASADLGIPPPGHAAYVPTWISCGVHNGEYQEVYCELTYTDPFAPQLERECQIDGGYCWPDRECRMEPHGTECNGGWSCESNCGSCRPRAGRDRGGNPYGGGCV
ncbi:MAG TPA: hypothetical protein VNX21_05625 [Candidatus Thermoplasmatota archaeon]|nr:hypothetical protein [Candidatus Thermoplasmatota archaeon]